MVLLKSVINKKKLNNTVCRSYHGFLLYDLVILVFQVGGSWVTNGLESLLLIWVCVRSSNKGHNRK